MYAEITLYDDDGTKKNDKPYRISANEIHEHTIIEPHYEVVDYEFKFVWCERIPLDQREIDMLEREHAAYERGREQGREEIERYHAGGRYDDNA